MLKNLQGLKKECERVIKNQNLTGKQRDWDSLNSVKSSLSWMLIQPCLKKSRRCSFQAPWTTDTVVTVMQGWNLVLTIGSIRGVLENSDKGLQEGKRKGMYRPFIFTVTYEHITFFLKPELPNIQYCCL